MNNKQRRRIRDCVVLLQGLRDRVLNLAQEEEEKLINIPDSLSSSDKYMSIEEASMGLWEILEKIDEIIIDMEGFEQ